MQILKIYENLSKEQLRANEQFVARTIFPLIYESSQGTHIQGSGSFYKSGQSIFLITAAHTLIDIDLTSIGIPEAPLSDVRIRSFDDFVIHKPDNTALDVAILQLGEGKFLEEVVPAWTILSEENVNTSDQSEKSEYLIAGYPVANIDLDENRLVPKSLFQLYTSHYSGEVDKGRDEYDLFLRHRREVANENNERINIVSMEGASGSPVWLLQDNDEGIWAPSNQLKLAGIQVAYKANNYIRVKKWSLVEEIIRRS